MQKELVITIIVVIFIFGLNYITQKNTDDTVDSVSNRLEIVRNDVIQDEVDKEKATLHVNDAFEKWEELDDTLAYYIEHNEIEKVTTALTSVKSYVEMDLYEDSVEAIDKCIYILDHIHQREMVTLDNIF